MKYLDSWKAAFCYEGRSNRKEFWGFHGISLLIGIAISLPQPLTSNPLPTIVGTLFYLATIPPSISLTVRRLHDTGRSGLQLLWLQGFPLVTLGASVLVPKIVGLRAVAIPLSVMLGLCWLWAMWLMLKRGDVSHNQFGDTPSRAGNDDTMRRGERDTQLNG